MATVRLTNNIREALLNKLLERAFKARCEEFRKRAGAFAVRVYADVFGDELPKMDALPDGWLPKDYGILVYFGFIRARISFNGSLDTSGVDNFLKCGSRGGDSVYRRFTYSKYSSVAKRYNARDALATEYEAFSNERKDLSNEIERAAQTAKAALDSCSSIQKLIAIWPEVEEFAREFLKDGERKALLPDIPRSQLNAILNLPPEEDKK